MCSFDQLFQMMPRPSVLQQSCEEGVYPREREDLIVCFNPFHLGRNVFVLSKKTPLCSDEEEIPFVQDVLKEVL